MSRVINVIRSGAHPRFDRTGNTLLLGTGNNFVRLTDRQGQLTQAGQAYEAATGQEIQAGLQNQAPTRTGRTESIRMPNGRKAVLRRYNPVTNRWDFTALGRTYYSRLRRNYVVHIPVTIRGLRKNGTTYETKAVVPVERTNVTKPSIALNTHEDERDGLIKQLVLDEIPEDGVTSSIPWRSTYTKRMECG